jgi:predicted small lipoprotein YifL
MERIDMFMTRKYSAALVLPAAVALLALAACGNKTPPPAATSAEPAVQAEIDKNAEMKAKEEELARKEAELALKEREQDLARRETELANKTAAAAKPKPKPAATAAPAATTASTAPAPKPVPSGPRQYTVPSGTSLSVQLPAAITTKNAKVGDRVSANLNSDLVVDGKVIAKAGALLQGSITEVVSGSNKIGGTPTLGLNFDNLTLADGSDTRVSATIKQVSAKSDTGRDAAKIAGGAAIGAILGNQVSSSNGKIVGALIGAGAGAAIAKQTGTEVELPAGTVLGLTLTAPVTVEM